jgi:hypothetical protein
MGVDAPFNLFAGIQVTHTDQRRANFSKSCDFHSLGVNRIGSYLFFQSINSQSDHDFKTAIAIMIAIENRSGKIGDRF